MYNRVFHQVLKALLHLHQHNVWVLNTPNTLNALNALNPQLGSSKYHKYKYFNGCVGALDGTHINTHVPVHGSAAFCNRKGVLSQNVLAVCGFNMQFQYVLPGWEGSAHDGKVLRDALMNKGFAIPPGKYFLADVGYAVEPWLLVPYKGVWYHLKEAWEADQK
jgi:hypothetical protein